MVPEPSAAGGKITVTVFKVTGETNTDDLSGAGCVVETGYPVTCAGDAENAREGIEPDQPGVVGPIKQIEALQKKATRWLTWVTWWAPVLPVNPRPTRAVVHGR